MIVLSCVLSMISHEFNYKKCEACPEMIVTNWMYVANARYLVFLCKPCVGESVWKCDQFRYGGSHYSC